MVLSYTIGLFTTPPLIICFPPSPHPYLPLTHSQLPIKQPCSPFRTEIDLCRSGFRFDNRLFSIQDLQLSEDTAIEV